ncbi:MAG: S8 family serine peptidase [Candidatus Acidiferrales bacterium]
MTTPKAKPAQVALLLGLALACATAALFGWASLGYAQSQPGEDTGVQRPARGQPAYKPDEVLVRFKPGVPKPAMEAAHGAVRAQLLRSYTSAPRLQLVRLPAGIKVREALRAYRSNPDVLYAQPNYIHRAQVMPNDPQFSQMWGLHNTGQAGGGVDADIDAPEAWDITKGSSNVVVVIIDTGVDFNHPDLSPNMIQLEFNCSDGLDNDSNGFIDDCRGIDTFNGDTNPFDDHGHGTHVSGTIGAAGNNNMGVVGVNWTVKLAACKFLGGEGFGFTSGAIDCLDYVAALKDAGVNVVATNNSWGGGPFEQALFDAIDEQRQRGILFIAAAGNAAADNDSFQNFPSNYYVPNVIAVAAGTRNDALAGFSSFGRHTVHLAAPGQEILSTTPGNTYSTFNGTSMATPHVAGVAALLKAQDPSRDGKAIKNLILAGGVDVADFSQTITGKRLNAHGAMTCADSTLLSRLQPVRDGVPGAVGEPIELAVLHINCAAPNGNVQVTVEPGGSTLTLFDDGNGADQQAGDGIYSGEFTPTQAGFTALEFPDGSTVNVLIPSAEPYVLFDLESEPGFTAQQFGDTFNWNSTSNRGNDPGHSPVTSFYFGDPTRFTYNCGSDPVVACHEAGLLTSPPITLGPGPHLLAFNYFLESEPGFDFAAAYVFDGADFFLLLHNFDGGLEINTGQWHQAVADLSPFAGQTVQIAFYFDTLDALFNDFEGWYVDDVIVDGQNIGLSAQGAAVAEGESGTSPLDFAVRLSRASQDTVTVNFATADGSATAPEDYQAASGMLTFMPGETLKTVSVLVNGDTTREPDETFSLDLSGASNAVVAVGAASGVILHDEPNALPTVNAGPDQTLPFNATLPDPPFAVANVMLSGSASDADGDPLTFAWKRDAGTLATGATATVPLATGVHNLRLEVSDGIEVATDNLVVTVTDFDLFPNPFERTILAGQSTTFTISGLPLFGPFNVPVTLSCPGPLPVGVTCSFSPATVTPGAGGAISTLTIRTAGPAAQGLPNPFEDSSQKPFYALWLLLPGLVGLALMGRRGRPTTLAALGLLLVLATSTTGCGGGSSAPTAFTAPSVRTPSGSHAILVQGSVSVTGGTVNKQINVTLNVQ